MEYTSIALWLAVLAVVLIPLALMLYADSRGMFDEIGGGPFSLEDYEPPPESSGAVSEAERELEIRQLIEARNHRAIRRGDQALDVDAELGRLLALDPAADLDRSPSADAALREEVRGMVLARNRRREAKGQPPLDVEAEIDRQLLDAGA